MKSLKVSFTAPKGAHRHLVLDGQAMRIKDGKASRQVKAGKHDLNWYVVTAPHTAYTMEVTAPPEAKTCSAKDVNVGPAGYDAGVCEITVS